jgi:UDP-N-acetylmuramoyl-tripeptide--D-alanyl-D-alanine ligase
MNMTLVSAAQAMNGVLQGSDRIFDGVSTDTRTLRSGELFFALQGPNFDGEKFVKQARDKGAAAAVVATTVENDIAQIEVDDTRLALGRLGAAWRQQQSARVIGITGSNGKTTLKELTAACLSEVASTLATEGNFNNDIGMPLMLLKIDASHEYAVLELGANHAGEIAYLASLAQPNIVVITNAAAAHLEGFGSIEGVAQAKGEILCGEVRPDFAILNADDEFFDTWSSQARDVNVLSFGLDETADVRAEKIETESDRTRFVLIVPEGAIAVNLPLVGIHNVRNACAAAAIATALGMSAEKIAKALESVSPIAGRLQALEGINGITLYDDTYNANPLSVTAAAEFVANLPGEGWLVLGDMGELGSDEQSLHEDVGSVARSAGVDRLFAIGELSRNTVSAFGENASWHESVESLVAAISNEIADETAADINICIKGSRFMRMERVVAQLSARQLIRREA